MFLRGNFSCQNLWSKGLKQSSHFGKRFLFVARCPITRVGQGNLLSGMSGVTAQDALYASFEEERARPT
jgi:hypothetical protein